ncbi:MAG TPA: cytidylate kinase-like family protein [Gemmatimonadaceae bacterium]|nr:cytidylate kinase-like family protein [Gemmatimonadaceae bacterium]
MPVITISRLFGSGGSDVAAQVADTLGWTLLDNALVDRVAARLGRTPVEVQAIEERVPSLAERLADALALGSPEIVSPSLSAPLPPTEERLLEVTERVIDDAVARGPVVLVGRGAQSYLAQHADALHVFCHAPRPSLIARVVEREGISPEEAARRVDETNKRREQYVRRYWHRSWREPENYHICVNTEWLGIDGAAELIVRVATEHLA